MHASQHGADVSGHVVSAFVRVPISTILRRRAVEKRLKIGANLSRGVLLYQQPRRGMPAKQGQEPGLKRMRLQPIQDFAGDFYEPAATRRNRENIDELAHLKARRRRRTRRVGNTSLILALSRRPRASGRPKKRPKCG